MFRSFLLSLVATATLLTSSALCQGVFAQDEAAAYEEPAIQQEGGWTLVLVPDPQAYTRYSRNHGILDLMTAWIAENVKKLNVKQVVCVGDLVESNNLQFPDGRFANQTSKQMWECSSRSFGRLDGVVPYLLCTGNHDYGSYVYPDGNHYGTRSSLNRETQFNSYFPIDRNPALKDVLFETFENAFGYKSLENAAYRFEGTDGQKIVVVVLEFAPRDEALAWAKGVFERPENADAFGIVVAHSYMTPYTRDAARIAKENYGLNKEGGNAGEGVWEKLVYPTANVRMVLCGHVSTADDMDGCTGYRVDANAAGKPVYQLVCDMQAMGGGWEGNGGDGWLQLLEFSKDMKTIKVRTFSPLFAISPVTRARAWYRNDRQQFDINVE